MNSAKPEGSPPCPEAPGLALSLFDVLTPEQFDQFGEISVSAVASFHEQYERLPDPVELSRIVQLVARYIMAPDAPSFEVQ